MSALLAAGLTAATGLGNILSTGQLNRKNRKFQEDMWNKANAYNTPMKQMERFKQAGLNPHLIYGQGNAGNTSYINPHQQETPDLTPFSEATMNYVSTKKQQTETDNMATAREVMEKDILLKQASTLKTLADVDQTNLNTDLLRSNFDTILEQNVANLDKTKVDTEATTLGMEKTTQEITNLSAQLGLTEAQTANVKQQTAQSVQQVKLMIKDGKLKDAKLVYDNIVNDWAKRGINFNTGAKDQLIKGLMDVFGINPENTKKAGDVVKDVKTYLWNKILDAFK